MKATLLKKWMSFKSRHVRKSRLADQLQSDWTALWITGSEEAVSMDIIN